MVSKDTVYSLNQFAKSFYEKQLGYRADEWFSLENVKRRIVITDIINENLQEIDGGAAIDLSLVVREAEERLHVNRSLILIYINDIGYVTGINYSGNKGSNFRTPKPGTLFYLFKQETATIKIAFGLFYQDKNGRIHKKKKDELPPYSKIG